MITTMACGGKKGGKKTTGKKVKKWIVSNITIYIVKDWIEMVRGVTNVAPLFYSEYGGKSTILTYIC